MSTIKSPFDPEAMSKNRERREQVDELARMDKIVENSSEKNRNFFIAYLSFLVYVQGIIFSTSDYQLLIFTEGLKLPLVDLNVSLNGFFVVIPIFIIALHFNFLQNLESHHYKLMQWQKLHTGGVIPRKYIYPFLFDYAILEQDSHFHRLVKFANSLLCYNFAPITLGLLLIRFSDQQDFLITAWHFFCFLVDMCLFNKYQKAINQNEKDKDSSKNSNHIWIKIWQYMFFVLILLETILAGLIGGTNDEFFVRHIQSHMQPIFNKEFLVSENTFIKKLNLFVNRPVEWLLPRISIYPTLILWQPDVSTFESSAKLYNYDNWAKYFNNQGSGFRPSISGLRFANLPLQNLPRSQLAGIQLQGANLSEAKLQGSDLSGALLQGANLTKALLQKTNLDHAQLQGTHLYYAELQGANLEFASLQMASLLKAQLQGANLTNSKMQAASLSGANMQGSYLNGTEMQGVFLNFADMRGVHFRNAHLEGASLNNTLMDGIILEDTDTEQKIIANDKSRPGFFIYSLARIDSVDWGKIKKYGDSISNKSLREDYKTRIREAANNKRVNNSLGQIVYHAPQEIGKTVIGDLCSLDSYQHVFYDKFDKFSAIHYFRLSYQKLKQSIQDPLTEKEYKKLLIDIDNKLCTLPECADIRDKIDGLNCAFPKRSRSKAG